MGEKYNMRNGGKYNMRKQKINLENKSRARPPSRLIFYWHINISKIYLHIKYFTSELP